MSTFKATEPLSVLRAAAATMTIAAIGQASQSPDLLKALVEFDFNNVTDQDSTALITDTSMLDEGPATLLSIALGDSRNAAQVKKLIEANEAAILDNLAPAVAATRTAIGLR